MSKLTDAEILKALECCINKKCFECSFRVAMNCSAKVPMAFALNLIKRQQAEIERLKQLPTHITVDKTAFEECCYNIETAKAEAYQEFAERLKEKMDINSSGYILITEMTLDNLLKEITEESK